MRRLEDKVAIVTGAGKGLGRAFAQKFAEEGAMVSVVDIEDAVDTVREIEKRGGVSYSIMADVSQEKDIFRMTRETMERFGRIDILVNNAALIPERKPFDQITPDEWDTVMAVNVKGPWLCTRAVFPHMKEQGKGKVINISSEVFFTGSQGLALYVSSKGGVIALTRAMAVELGPHNICVNSIAPGFTDIGKPSRLKAYEKYDVSRTPLRRLGKSSDIVGLLVFLASYESDFITGQTILVNGGRAVH